MLTGCSPRSEALLWLLFWSSKAWAAIFSSSSIHSHHTLLQVSIVAFKKGKLEVLAHAWDRNLGGRDFDEVLFDCFVKEFGDKYKIDIRSNPRASFRLRMACEKVRGSGQGW